MLATIEVAPTMTLTTPSVLAGGALSSFAFPNITSVEPAASPARGIHHRVAEAEPFTITEAMFSAPVAPEATAYAAVILVLAGGPSYDG